MNPILNVFSFSIKLLIIHWSSIRHPTNFDDINSYLFDNFQVASTFVPDRDSVLVVSYRNNDTVYFIRVRKLFANHTHGQVFPKLVGNVWVLTFIVSDLKSTTVCVLFVFPSWFNTLNEEIVHGSLLKLTWSLQKLLNLPELLNGRKISDWFWFPISFGSRFHEAPEGIFFLKPFVLGVNEFNVIFFNFNGVIVHD